MTAASVPRGSHKTAGKSTHPLADRARFKVWNTDKLRLTDVDHQHHVNNAIFAVLYTSVRADFLKDYVRPLVAKTDLFALVKITIEYLAEMHYPGEVDVGISIRRFGRASITFAQGMFKDGKCVSVSATNNRKSSDLGKCAHTGRRIRGANE